MAFIGIDRGIRNHWIYQDSEYFHVWFEMIACARFTDDTHRELIEGELVEVNYGEFIFGRIKWSERLRVSEQRLRTLITKLIKDDMLELVKKHRKCTIYRLKNYEKFNHQSNQQNYLIEQGFESPTNQQSNQRATSSQPAANQQPTTNNKDNKDNKEKQSKTHYAENVLLTEKEYQNLCSKYGQELTDRSIEYLSLYKVEKEYKTKSDNLTLQRWVIDAVKKSSSKIIKFSNETRTGQAVPGLDETKQLNEEIERLKEQKRARMAQEGKGNERPPNSA